MSVLTSLQTKHFFNICRWGLWLGEQGYEPAFGEAYRPDWVAFTYAAFGRGIKASLHCDRMATDVIIRKDGVEVALEDYKRCGEAWEALDTDNAWGGRFEDGQHFSHKYGGRK